MEQKSDIIIAGQLAKTLPTARRRKLIFAVQTLLVIRLCSL